MRWWVAARVASLFVARAAWAIDPHVRKASERDLTFEVEKTTTANGMVVLLSPDPRSASVVVDITFRAGTVHEPPGRSGLAHLTEHLMMRGSTPETDYVAILEKRAASYLNATTTPETMTFRAVVPRAELPIALWVAADRIGTLRERISDSDLERERRVVLAERAETFLDVPYSSAESTIDRALYPDDHPMRGSVIGIPKEIEKVNLDEVRAFVDRHLVPANATLSITGAFDLAVAHRWIDDTLGKLPAGTRVDAPPFVKAGSGGQILKIAERSSRLPRVTFAWRMSRSDLDTRVLDALDFGAELLTIYLSGFFGTQVRAELLQQGGEAIFRLDTTLPYDKPVGAAQEEAEAVLRYLTRVTFPEDLIEATLLARDRYLLFALDSPAARATLITQIELSGRDPTRIAADLGRFWSADLGEVQRIAAQLLGGSKVIVHAVPTHPRKPKVSRSQVLRQQREDDE